MTDAPRPAAPRRGRANRDTEPPFDPTSWHGALIVMAALGAVLWVVQIVNAERGYDLDRRFGLKPRQVDGLWGIVTQPFLHASYSHLASNSVAVVGIGWVVLLSGVRTWAVVTASVILVGGLATWLIGPGHSDIVGASALVLGWLGYLLARAYFSRRVLWIVTAVVVLFFFGTLLGSLLPEFGSSVSWQSHVCGFLAGVATAAVLHPRHRKRLGRTEPGASAVS